MNTPLPTARRPTERSAQPADPRRPGVSVCIPAFQAERHLQATIDSVLAQDYADLEVVIVDNNSSDGTRDILERLTDRRVRVIRNPTTLPIADNFNFAIRQSRGQFVKLVCADDLLKPDCIAAQASILENHPDVAVVSARTDFIDDEGKLIRRERGLRGGRRATLRRARGGPDRSKRQQSDRPAGSGDVPARGFRPVLRLQGRNAVPDGDGVVGAAT